MMIKDHEIDRTYGHDRDKWENAKAQAMSILRRTARTNNLVTYGDLAREISVIHFDPHGDDFRHFLGQMSWSEDACGRGLITAIVVHKADLRPGVGFFTLAKNLGRDVSDEERCWADEVSRVFKDCAQ